MAEVVLDDYQQIVMSNATVTSSGSSMVAMDFGHKEITLLINLSVAPTGSSPTITFTVEEIDPGDGVTVLGTAATGATLSSKTVQILPLPVTYGGNVLVTWTVTGGTPSFTGVYATIVNKGPSPAIYDQAGNGPVAVKPASAAVAAGDPSLAVGLSPNSPLPAGANAIGTVAQGAAAAVAGGWPVKVTDGVNIQPTMDVAARAGFQKITDGTNTQAVKAASTAAVATDPSAVVALSPNTSLPAGTNALGTVTAVSATPANLQAEIGGLGAAGAVPVGNPVLSAGSDGVDTRTLLTDASGRQAVVGAAAAGAAVAGNPVLVAGSDGANARDLATDTSGRQQVVGAAAVGAAPAGNPLYLGADGPSGTLLGLIAGLEGSLGIALMSNEFAVHANSTITASGSTTVSKNFYGTQQISLIVNVKASPTGTTPTITFSIQEVDPGDGTTVMNTAVSTASFNAIGVYTATLNSTTSGLVKISWTVTGTTPSFTQVYSTVVSKATPTSQAITSAPTNATISGFINGDVVLTSTGNVAVRRTALIEQTSNAQRSIVSSSANDSSAGTGARQVTITYYDSTGAGPSTEVVTMNGTTAVNTVSTTICFVERIDVTSVGSTGSNVGTLTLKASTGGTGATIVTMSATDNRLYLATHYVADGKTCYVTGINVGSNSSGISQGGLYTLRAQTLGVSTAPDVPISDELYLFGQSSGLTRNYSTPIKVVGPARIQLWVNPFSNNTITFGGGFDFYEG